MVLVSSFYACKEPKLNQNQVTKKSDYQGYLETTNSEVQKQQLNNLSYWKNKYEQQPSQYPYLSKIANVHTQLFNTTGDIKHLKAAEKHLKKQIQKRETASNLRQLAKNYISQHRFQESLMLLKKAEEDGEKLLATQKMLFDVYLEIGNYKSAKTYLDKIYALNDFDYLIRAAKWNDTQGELNNAIRLLEKALERAESSNNKALKIWSYSNLADFYGHHNEIQKSYDYYLKTLSLDPSNAYAKKGIAWIAYSHEKNPKEAFRILNTIQSYHNAPDYHLFKAELAEYQQNAKDQKKHIHQFMSVVEEDDFGVMYDQHLIKLHAEETKTTWIALNLLRKEISNRPTPENYDLWAWALLNKGDAKKSLQIAQEHVMGKSHEPEVLYHLAEIYKRNGLNAEVQKLKKELLESAFEIGPVLLTKVENI